VRIVCAYPAGGLTGTPIQVSGFTPEIDTPTVHVWNLTVSKRITNSIVLEADYLGNHAYNLSLQANANRYAGDLIQHNGSLTRLNPYFGPIIFGRSTGYSDGHYGPSGQQTLWKRISAKGIYSFGKATDLTSSNDNGVGGGQNVFDAANPGGQHAVPITTSRGGSPSTAFTRSLAFQTGSGKSDRGDGNSPP
jgi:hypothetical protein